MDQNQALALLDRVTSRIQLTRQEHENVKTALYILTNVAKQFTVLTLEKQAVEAEKKKASPEAPKEPIDNLDKSQA